MDLLTALKKQTHPDLIPTSDGAFTLYDEKNKLVHSSRSPLKETQKFIQNLPQIPKEQTLIIAWGTGLGYHIEILLNQGYKVVAIELRPKVAAYFKQYFPLSRLEGFFNSHNISNFFDFFVQLDPFQFQNFVDLKMLGIEISDSVYEIYRQGKKIFRSLKGIQQTLVEQWYKNILTNFAHSYKYSICTEPIFAKQNLAICSAGPSLRESLPYLKNFHNDLTILSVDTALQSLIEYGIIPDYVHSVDAKIHNISDFQAIPPEIFSQITLIADITLSPRVLQLPWKAVLLVSTANPIIVKNKVQFHRTALQQWLWDSGFQLPETQSGGSVATSAFHLGILYQAQQILLIGQDLAYSNNRGHSVGSPYDREYRNETHRLRTLDSIHCSKVPFDRLPTQGIVSEEVFTDPLLDQFRLWFENSYSAVNIPLVNASENGAKFNHWNHKALSTFKQFPKTQKPNHNYKQISPTLIQNLFQQIVKFDWNFKGSNPIYKEFFAKEIFEQAHINNFIEKQNKIFQLCRRLYDSTNLQ